MSFVCPTELASFARCIYIMSDEKNYGCCFIHFWTRVEALLGFMEILVLNAGIDKILRAGNTLIVHVTGRNVQLCCSADLQPRDCKQRSSCV